MVRRPFLLALRALYLKWEKRLNHEKIFLNHPSPWSHMIQKLLQKQKHSVKNLTLKVHEIYSKAAATIFYRPHLWCFSFNFMKFLKAPFLQCWWFVPLCSTLSKWNSSSSLLRDWVRISLLRDWVIIGNKFWSVSFENGYLRFRNYVLLFYC